MHASFVVIKRDDIHKRKDTDDLITRKDMMGDEKAQEDAMQVGKREALAGIKLKIFICSGSTGHGTEAASDGETWPLVRPLMDEPDAEKKRLTF